MHTKKSTVNTETNQRGNRYGKE